MPDLAVSNDTEIIAKVQKTAEILMNFKVHTYGEQTVGSILPQIKELSFHVVRQDIATNTAGVSSSFVRSHG